MEKAEKFLKSVSSYSTNDRFDDCEYTWDSVIDWLNDYASQQCAELQEINRVYKNCQEKDGETIKSLQSENESLKKRVEECDEFATKFLEYASSLAVSNYKANGTWYLPDGSLTSTAQILEQFKKSLT